MFRQAVKSNGHGDEMTEERRINSLLEAGYNVFTLRWKKVHPFKTSMFGVEIVTPISRIDSQGNVKYSCQNQLGELKFHPDETIPEEQQVPIAYMADTAYNRTILRNSYFSAQYIIANLITPT